MSEELLAKFYERYSYYNLTVTQLFGDDENMTFAEKYKYYTQVFPSAFLQAKNNNQDIANIPIVKMMAVEGNRIILRKSGRLSKDETDTLTRNLDDMLFSGDPIQQKLAVDLFMYSFYREKCSRDHSSFGHLFSTQFIECFPEYNRQCEIFKQMCEDDGFMRGFQRQFVYNNADEFFVSINPEDIDATRTGDGMLYLSGDPEDMMEYIKISPEDDANEI